MKIHAIKWLPSTVISNQKGNKLLQEGNDAYLPLNFMMLLGFSMSGIVSGVQVNIRGA